MMNTLIKGAFIALLFGVTAPLFAQNVGINTTGATPSTNAILDLSTGNAKNKGLIIPRVVLGTSLSTFSPPMANAPAGKDSGIMVFNYSATNQPVGYYLWTGSTWTPTAGTQTFYTVKDSNLKSTTSSTYQTAVSLTVPAGTYMITFSAQLANNHYNNNDTPNGTWYKFTDGTSVFGNSVIDCGDNAGYYVPVSIETTMTYNSSTTLYIQYNEYANNSYKSYIKNAVITAIKVN